MQFEIPPLRFAQKVPSYQDSQSFIYGLSVLDTFSISTNKPSTLISSIYILFFVHGKEANAVIRSSAFQSKLTNRQMTTVLNVCQSPFCQFHRFYLINDTVSWRSAYP
jgi:hypothetical protein